MSLPLCSYVFFFKAPSPTAIYTLSLHDALPISARRGRTGGPGLLRRDEATATALGAFTVWPADRKSTRLNSSHGYISYAVFCLKKKKKKSVAHYAAAVLNLAVVLRRGPRDVPLY